MVECSWCKYSLDNIYPGFLGYKMFDYKDKVIDIGFCSINCCVSQIYKYKRRIEERYIFTIQHYKEVLPEKYQKDYVPKADDPEIISKIGLENYRKDFLSPFISEMLQYYFK